MNLNRIAIAASAAVIAASSAVFAHGPQLQITYDATNNRIVTNNIINTTFLTLNPPPFTVTSEKRVFVIPLTSRTSSAGTYWYVRPDVATPDGFEDYASDPGVAYQYESFVPGTGWQNTNADSTTDNDALPNLNGKKFSFTFSGGLKKWNGSSFGSVVSESLQVSRGGGITHTSTAGESTTLRYIDSSTADETLNIFTDASTGIGALSANPHNTATYRLLGTDELATDLDGIYLAQLQVNTTATQEDGVTPINSSLPFYYVFYKPADVWSAVSVADSFAAAQGFGSGAIQLVPEPTTLGFLGIGALAMIRRRQK